MPLRQPNKPPGNTPDELKMAGSTMVRVRAMSRAERTAEGWQDYPDDIPCTEYDNGAILYSGCERCAQPGTIYALHHGERWGIDPAAEVGPQPPQRRSTSRWVYLAAAAVLLMTAVATAGVVTQWGANQDRLDLLAQQSQIAQKQQTIMDRQLANQRAIRANQADLEKLIRGNQTDSKELMERALRRMGWAIAHQDALEQRAGRLQRGAAYGR